MKPIFLQIRLCATLVLCLTMLASANALPEGTPGSNSPNNTTAFVVHTSTRSTAAKVLESSDHLGNIRSVVSDQRNSDVSTGLIDESTAHVDSWQNYYAFGSAMPNRGETVSKYRFGFNGHEPDNLLKGPGNSYDFGARFYASRLGKFFTADPWESKYPWQSTYAYFENRPVSQIDWKGFGDDKKVKSNPNNPEKKNATTEFHQERVETDRHTQAIPVCREMQAKYSTYDDQKPVHLYNCFGLAMRTHNWHNIKQKDIAFLQKQSVNEYDAQPGDLLLTLWTFDLTSQLGPYGEPDPDIDYDFHIVGQVIGLDGSVSAEIFSKDGARPVYQQKLDVFRPLPLQQYYKNLPTGEADVFLDKPVMAVRKNIVETQFIIPQAAIQNLINYFTAVPDANLEAELQRTTQSYKERDLKEQLIRAKGLPK